MKERETGRETKVRVKEIEKIETRIRQEEKKNSEGRRGRKGNEKEGWTKRI